MPLEGKPPAEIIPIRKVTRQEKGPLPETKNFSPDRLSDKVAEFILSGNPNVTIEGPVEIKKGYGQVTFQMNLSMKMILGNAKGRLEVTLTSYLTREMIKAGSPQIEAGSVSQRVLRGVFPPSSLLTLPEELKKYFENKESRTIEKISITEDGEFVVVFKKNNTEPRPTTSPAIKSKPKQPPVPIDPNLLEEVEITDYAEAERLTAAREAKKSKVEMQGQARRAKEQELLDLPRVMELKDYYAKRVETATIPAKKKDAEDNLTALGSAENLLSYFKDRLEKNYDSKDAEAVAQIEQIGAKYAPILEESVE